MKKQKQEQTGQVNFVWALAGGYLIYLGGKLLYSLYRDGAGSSPVLVVIPAAAVFIGVGFWLLRREWKAYQFGAAHKDDPSTWNDDPVEEALPAWDMSLRSGNTAIASRRTIGQRCGKRGSPGVLLWRTACWTIWRPSGSRPASGTAQRSGAKPSRLW